MWQEFQRALFFNTYLSLAFILNIDWFQPYTHTRSSVGVVYLSVLNLPRFLRYKCENVILIGIIPGPREPEDLNPFLKPLVDELLELWEGVRFSVAVSTGRTEQVIRGALLCVACDLPAGRKTCGFLGHSANLGCSKCFKIFKGDITNKDYSGFNRSEWKVRSNKEHRESDFKLKVVMDVGTRFCLNCHTLMPLVCFL